MITIEEAAGLRTELENELNENIIPFWERFSPDRECGGYYTCLDRDGAVFDTDKFIWMQGRELWCFSHLFRTVRPEPAWRDIASLGADFLRKYGKAPGGDYYFSLDRAGKPLVQPYNIFTDCFCATGLAEYGRISGEQWALDEAILTWRRIQVRKSWPKGVWTKQIAGARPVMAMSMPMMQVWMADVFSGLIPRAELDAIVDEGIEQVLALHIDTENHAVFERVFADGTRPDCMEGRLLTPGHALETLWFILDVAACRRDTEVIGKVCAAMIWVAERGWDEKYGGIYYYQDFLGRPTEKIEADMKLWWVHAEALCAFLLAWKTTGDDRYGEWFRKIKAWTWEHFPDREYGEWYGYLDRRGDPALTLKGGKWKGMFHIPRALMSCAAMLRDMEKI